MQYEEIKSIECGSRDNFVYAIAEVRRLDWCIGKMNKRLKSTRFCVYFHKNSIYKTTNYIYIEQLRGHL